MKKKKTLWKIRYHKILGHVFIHKWATVSHGLWTCNEHYTFFLQLLRQKCLPAITPSFSFHSSSLLFSLSFFLPFFLLSSPLFSFPTPQPPYHSLFCLTVLVHPMLLILLVYRFQLCPTALLCPLKWQFKVDLHFHNAPIMILFNHWYL